MSVKKNSDRFKQRWVSKEKRKQFCINEILGVAFWNIRGGLELKEKKLSILIKMKKAEITVSTKQKKNTLTGTKDVGGFPMVYIVAQRWKLDK